MTARVLSPAARAVLSYVREYSATYGYAPNLREVAAGCSLSSTSVASARLAELEARGLIRRRRGIARGITLIRAGAQS